MNKELAEAVKLFVSQPLNFPLSRGQIMEVARIALPILEQQERGEGWIEWGGGKCPVSPESVVSVKFRDGGYHERNYPAGSYRWHHSAQPYSSGDDIIAYRIIPERVTNQNGEQ